MATVDKNFKVKNGLVVEGSTATVNGEDIITTGSTTDVLPEGSSNLYFTNQRAIDAVSGDISSAVSTAIDALDTDDIEEGVSNLYYTTARAKGDAADLLTNATLTNITITGNGSGLTITAENGVADSDTDDLTEGVTNLYFTNQRALDATASAYDATGTAQGIVDALDTDDIEEGVTNLYFTNQRALDATSSAYDASGSASTAESNANTYTDNAINGLDTDDIEEGVTNLYFTNQRALDATASAYDASGAASTAETNAKAYADDLIGDVTVDGTAGNTITDRIATAVSDLVDGAPALLDTLNELAAAINDDESFATTIGTQISGKQDTLTAGTGITIDQITDTISVTANTYDAYGAASQALSDAEDYADGLASNYDAAGTASGLVDDLKDGTTAFTAVNIDSLAKQVAATATSLGSVVVTAYQFPKASYKTAKFLVKIDNGTENEVSEVLLTLDSGDNIAITEYAIVGTNGSRGTITADISGSNVRLRVNPVNDSTINVVGTLLV
jgi:hypothetical protein